MTPEEKIKEVIKQSNSLNVLTEKIISICKQEIEQAEISGWNKCYRTYIEDNDDDTALTNKQEIEDAKRQAKIEGLGMFLKELNPYQMVGELSGTRAQRDADLMMKVQIAIKELKDKK